MIYSCRIHYRAFSKENELTGTTPDNHKDFYLIKNTQSICS